jgi:hypothetical protein
MNALIATSVLSYKRGWDPRVICNLFSLHEPAQVYGSSGHHAYDCERGSQ